MPYDYASIIPALDQRWPTILPCIGGAIVFTFIYFTTAVRQAIREQVYVESFAGAALFFWHDLSYVLSYPLWFGDYRHWWFQAWCFALIGTVLFEAFLIYQVFKYGRDELWPKLSGRSFGILVILGTLGVGAMWYLIKVSMNDRLFFITFAITAVWSAPFHTALMCRRQNRAGQAFIRQICMAANLVLLTAAFAQVDPFFLSPAYLAFAIAFTAWPLANIWLILRLPAYRPAGLAGYVAA